MDAEDVTEEEAVEAFERLGLTGYQAKGFIALHRLGSGTARDISRVTDVPRSQVYSAADTLADKGLVGIQQSSPIRYRPVSLEAAQSTLRERFERETDRAFEFVDSVRGEGDGEEREELWTLRGRDAVSDRVAELVGEADRRIVYGTGHADHLTEDLVGTLSRRAEEGLDAVLVTESEAVREAFSGNEGILTVRMPPKQAENDRTGRVLIVDDDVILLSVVDPGDSSAEGETAVWSAHTTFAEVLVQLVEASIESPE